MKPEFRATIDRFKSMTSEAQERALKAIDRKRDELNSLHAAMRRAQKEQKRLAGSGAG